MELRDKLEIIIVTFNRKQYLEKTLNTLFADNSPVKDLDITVLDNHSTDGTKELLENFAKRHENFKFITHPINIGAGANILRAYEIAKKDYLWVLCDNDEYDWTSFPEVVDAIKKDYPLILTNHIYFLDDESDKYGELFQICSFVPACIIKTSQITSTYLLNAYFNMENCFPQLGIAAKFINEDLDFYTVKNTIVLWRPNEDSMLRSHDDNLSCARRKWFWLWGYIRSCSLITDDKKRYSVMYYCRHFSPYVYGTYVRELTHAFIHGQLSFKHIIDMFWVLSSNCRWLLIKAYLRIIFKSLFLRKIYSTPLSKEQWKEYFEIVKQQKKINQLARKYKGKKVVLYGAGMFFEALNEYCDMTVFKNAVVCDRRFSEKGEFMGFKTLPVKDLENYNPDVIILTVVKTSPVLPSLCDLRMKKINILKEDKCVYIP